ncbi:MAG: hypothetical protein HFH91_15370 [Lachnospiraceae bacterium]|nr:hypothetical protein [Lachnospiraceae bacterium]
MAERVKAVTSVPFRDKTSAGYATASPYMKLAVIKASPAYSSARKKYNSFCGQAERMGSLGRRKNLRRRYRAIQRTSIWVRRKIIAECICKCK